MDAANDIAEFLTSRRAKITPEQAGLPSYGKRRVPGLRREEVASLAGMSVEYYKRLERGNSSGVSELVLEGLARALQLDEAERSHLFDLVRAAGRAGRGSPKRSRPVKQTIRPVVQRILDQISAPATVRNARLDYVGGNTLGRALYAPVFDSRQQPANSARFTFLDHAAADFYPDWNRAAADSVSLLRAEAGRNPDDRELTELIGDLTTRSERFSALWATHNVRWHSTGTKPFHHPVVGDLSLAYEGLELTADPGQTLITYTAEPGSTSEQALTFLASWAASPEKPTAHDRASEKPTT